MVLTLRATGTVWVVVVRVRRTRRVAVALGLRSHRFSRLNPMEILALGSFVLVTVLTSCRHRRILLLVGPLDFIGALWIRRAMFMLSLSRDRVTLSVLRRLWLMKCWCTDLVIDDFAISFEMIFENLIPLTMVPDYTQAFSLWLWTLSSWGDSVRVGSRWIRWFI